jgi:DMSO/TMAO reductase YedYZ molybdopterin-dependent catalytic subunit
MAGNPFSGKDSRPHVEGDFAREELALAYRNSALPLEALAYDVTPVGLHYTLSHFDVPRLDAAGFRLAVSGRVARPLALALPDIRRLPARTLRVTMECAGNGRGLMSPRYPSMPWLHEGVSTAEWTGAPLRHVLEEAGLEPDAVDIAFLGADRGFDRGVRVDHAVAFEAVLRVCRTTERRAHARRVLETGLRLIRLGRRGEQERLDQHRMLP